MDYLDLLAWFLNRKDVGKKLWKETQGSVQMEWNLVWREKLGKSFGNRLDQAMEKRRKKNNPEKCSPAPSCGRGS